MHLLGARNDEDIQEQLAAKREMPQWDSEDDDAAEKEVSAHVPSAWNLCYSTKQSPEWSQRSGSWMEELARCLMSAPKHATQHVQDDLRRAVAQDASLAEQYPELANLVAKNEAEAEKEKGNKAFSEKRCALDPSSFQARQGHHAPACIWL